MYTAPSSATPELGKFNSSEIEFPAYAASMKYRRLVRS